MCRFALTGSAGGGWAVSADVAPADVSPAGVSPAGVAVPKNPSFSWSQAASTNKSAKAMARPAAGRRRGLG